jgi:hypothetical protein
MDLPLGVETTEMNGIDLATGALRVSGISTLIY